MNGPGVYLWKNKVNNKVYVGSSINIRRRKAEHILRLNKGVENSEYFQRAWDKYGPEAFTFEVVEICSNDDRLIREQCWIDKLKAEGKIIGDATDPIAIVHTVERIYTRSLVEFEEEVKNIGKD